MNSDENIVERIISTLKDNPKLRERLLNELDPSKYVQRDELTILLKEIRELRLDTNKRFEAVDKRFEEIIESMNQRFEAVDKRFGAVDKRFEAVDKRFKELIESMNQRFEAVDKRFEELIESMNQRFEAVDKRFEELIESMNQRFEAVDRRFEELIEYMNQRFDEQDYKIKEIQAGIGTLGNRTGHEFETFILSLFEKILKKNGIDFKKVEKYGIRNEDPDILNGLNKITFDGYIQNDKKIILEVKYKTDINKVNWFYQRVRAFEKLRNIKPEMWILTVSIDENALEHAEELGIKVFTRNKKISRVID